MTIAPPSLGGSALMWVAEKKWQGDQANLFDPQTNHQDAEGAWGGIRVTNQSSSHAVFGPGIDLVSGGS